MRKGISPVIASIIVILVVISLAGGYSVFSGRIAGEPIEEGQQESEELTQRLDTQFRIDGVDGQDVILRNTGQEDLDTRLLTVTLDDARYNHTGPQTIPPGERGRITLNGLWETGPGEKRLTVGGPSLSDNIRVEVVRAENPILDIRFEQVSDEKVFDTSGRDNHGDIVGTPEVVEGQFGDAMDFDGIDNYIDLPSMPNFNHSLTISFWSYHPPTSGGNKFLVGLYDKNRLGAIDRPPPDNLFQFLMYDSSGNAKSVTANLERNEWLHWTAFWNGTTMQLYRNGGFKDQTNQAGGSQSYNRNDEIADAGWTSTSDSQFNGTIDEVLIYDRALKPDELYTLKEV